MVNLGEAMRTMAIFWLIDVLLSFTKHFRDGTNDDSNRYFPTVI